MFHLFNRVYLERKEFYNTNMPHLILFSEEGDHPISSQVSLDLDKIPGFGSYLEINHCGDIENFWKQLVEKPSKEGLVIFADQKLFISLQIQYWKSIFKKSNVKDVYKLYKFYFLDKKIKNILPTSQSDIAQIVEDYLSEEEFHQLYDSIESSKVILSMDKSIVSFEYLLANYFLNEKGAYSLAFMERLKELSWKVFFDNIEILRWEILNSFYDLKKIIPGAELNFNDIASVEQFIQSELKLRWILDPAVCKRDIQYTLSTYPKEIFLDITREVGSAWVANPNIPSDVFRLILESEDHYQVIECVYESRYLDLLSKSISKNFGCIFVSDDFNNKANQILPLFIYDKKRTNQLTELEFLELL